MNDDRKLRITFPLRLEPSLRDRAIFMADRDGISLNHFINQAVREKIGRLSANSPDLGRRRVTIEFSAYSVADLIPITVHIGDAVSPVFTSPTAETNQIDFTLEDDGEIWYRAPRDLFLKSTRY